MLMLSFNYARNIFLHLSIPKSLCVCCWICHQYITFKMYSILDFTIAYRKPACFPSFSHFCRCHHMRLRTQEEEEVWVRTMECEEVRKRIWALLCLRRLCNI